MLSWRFNVFRVGSNRVSVIWVKAIQIFAPIFFNLKIILTLRFSSSVISKVFTYWCIMLQKRTRFEEILRTPWEEVEAPLPSNLLAVSSNCSRWVHPDYAITTPPKSSSSHLSTTLKTTVGDVTITLYKSVNASGCLVRVDYGWLTHCFFQTRSITPEGLRASHYK